MKDIIYDESDKIYYDDNVIDSAIVCYDKLNAGFDSMSQDINKSGEINKKTDLFGAGITKISRQSAAISQRYNSTKNILKNSMDRWALLESKLKQEISSVTIPTIEALNSVSINTHYNNVTLQKNEGKQIKSDNASFSVSDFNSSINEKQEIDNVNNDNNNDTPVSEIYANSIINEEELIKALKSSDIQNIQLDSSYFDTDKQSLDNINNGITRDNVELNYDSSHGDKVEIQNINNDVMDQKTELNYNDFSMEKVRMDNINNDTLIVNNDIDNINDESDSNIDSNNIKMNDVFNENNNTEL